MTFYGDTQLKFSARVIFAFKKASSSWRISCKTVHWKKNTSLMTSSDESEFVDLT